MLKTVRKNLTKKNSDNLKKILMFSILSGGLIFQNGVAFAGDEENISTDENITNPYAYNTIELDAEKINFNGAVATHDGGYSATIQDKEGSGNVTYNKLTVNGGKFAFNILGGNYSGNFTHNQIFYNGGYLYFDISDATSYSGEISNNTFNINGGTYSNELIKLENAVSRNNTLTISGAPDISDSYLYGGILGVTGVSEGNILNVNTSNLTAKNIYDFDTINFNVPSSVTNGETFLTLTEEPTYLSTATVNAQISGGTSLNPGDTVNLISNANGLTTSGENSLSIAEGSTLTYENSTISDDGNNLILTLGDAKINESTKAFSQGVLNTANTLSRGTDRIIDWLPPEEIDEAITDGETVSEVVSNNWGIFANVDAETLKIKTGGGSFVDSKGGGMDLGFARALEDSRGGSLIFAPVFDYGKTSFDSYLKDGTHGTGHSRYFAGGIIGRKVLKNGFYFEGSFRGGSAKTDFASSDLLSSYSEDTPVFAGHIRAGRLVRLNRNNLLHYYGIYSHNHLNSFSANLSSGEHYNFDSVDSGKFRIGYRMTTRVSNLSKLYTGLAYQYEFNGSTSADYKNYTTAEAKVKGSSGMLELGWQMHNQNKTSWLVDFNVTGWIGVQKGVTGGFKLKKSF